jgi:hypothetical protein
MTSITDHEFIENEKGGLALLLHPIDEEIVQPPTFLVVREKAKAYLNLGGEDSHEIIGINPDVLEKLCAAESVLIAEVRGENALRSYDALVGLLREDGEEEKTITG